ncbi:efflux RND transporter permease subunit [Nitrobacter sp. TKz-YC02]|uniref:efflux RND transporter permease subunit n=1 Tax=Nitrobacter sp. TKz-YC02 TaxID=3398704 RepID=UPI003CEC5851
MRFSHFFIDRPIFASVLSIILTLVGAIALRALPITEYPEIAPPTIQVTATYAGAAADIAADTVASPIEQEINGVDNMIYMVSQSTGDGTTQINVVFKPGTNIDDAQVLVQNRVSIALPRLPEEVQRIGVTVKKKSPDLMMVIHLISPDDTLDQAYISNYATINIKDVLTRVDGVGDTIVFGARDYSMRIWLDPAKVQSRGLTASDVITALRGANIQVAAGAINQPPAKSPVGFELAVQTLGRLSSPEQFSDVIVATDQDGRVTRVRDIARVELGAYTYTTNAYLDGKVATGVGIYQRPGSNALKTAAAVIATMDDLAKNFPPGLSYRIAYNTTQFIEQSVHEVIKTLFEALVLVVLVIILFLQTWRAAIIPVVAIPVSLIGTFFVLATFGFSLNNLTLFGLVLAIGIVVDDAIVVVENVERYLRQGLSPRDAAHKTMDEVGGALVAIALVLCAVFIPTAFITGISGAFYRQFAITIASSTIISAIVSLTLSPALAALFLRPHDHEEKPGFWMTFGRPFNAFFTVFNNGFEKLSNGYAGLTRRIVRVVALMLLIYVGLIGLTYFQMSRTPSGFIPPLDRGYFITAITLPPGSSLERTDAVMRKASDRLLSRPGVAHTVTFAGFDGATFTNAPNSGVIFVTLKPFEEREKDKLKTEKILDDLRAQMQALREAFVLVIPPPSVPGIGTGGGFKLYVQDRGGRGPRALERVVNAITGLANKTPGLVQVFTLFNASTPQVFADIDRTKAEMLGVPISRFFDTLSTYMGSTYVNDFNILGRTYRVTAQADNPFRLSTRDVEALRTRSNAAEMVPLGAVATFRDITGPYRVPRYNLFPAAEVQGTTIPGFSTGQAIGTMEDILAKNLPSGFGFEWTEIALQEKVAGNTAVVAFGFAVVFVFLLLAAQYESVLLPLAVILIVPMCLLAAVTGVLLRGMDNNILTQIGFVVLIGLSSKNAILIVEFARQAENDGASRWDAAVQAARTRLRPILMTSIAFILGVVPLVIATGAGAELRQALGTAVFFGMLGVTLFGLVFTPLFYVLVRWIASTFSRRGTADTTQHPS